MPGGREETALWIGIVDVFLCYAKNYKIGQSWQELWIGQETDQGQKIIFQISFLSKRSYKQVKR